MQGDFFSWNDEWDEDIYLQEQVSGGASISRTLKRIVRVRVIWVRNKNIMSYFDYINSFPTEEAEAPAQW